MILPEGALILPEGALILPEGALMSHLFHYLMHLFQHVKSWIIFRRVYACARCMHRGRVGELSVQPVELCWHRRYKAERYATRVAANVP